MYLSSAGRDDASWLAVQEHDLHCRLAALPGLQLSRDAVEARKSPATARQYAIRGVLSDSARGVRGCGAAHPDGRRERARSAEVGWPSGMALWQLLPVGRHSGAHAS